jgi:hypothetical protein
MKIISRGCSGHRAAHGRMYGKFVSDHLNVRRKLAANDNTRRVNRRSPSTRHRDAHALASRLADRRQNLGRNQPERWGIPCAPTACNGAKPHQPGHTCDDQPQRNHESRPPNRLRPARLKLDTVGHRYRYQQRVLCPPHRPQRSPTPVQVRGAVTSRPGLGEKALTAP